MPVLELGKASSDDVSASDQDPTFVFTKVIKDDATATDDVEGEANIDDDQTMHFFKVTADQGGADDVFARTVSYNRDFTDDSGAEDSATLNVSKGLGDDANVNDESALSVSC